jgi:putative peptide zinc metalloprotease protein
MPVATPTKIPPARRPDLLMKPLGDDGQHVVKDLRAGTYFNLPPAEAFLLGQLDGKRSALDICTAFEKYFGEPLTSEDLDQFLEVAAEQNLLQRTNAAPDVAASQSRKQTASPLRLAQRILYFRRSVFDPDRLFTWLAPKIWFIWTAAFFWGSLAIIALAGLLLWQSWPEYTEYLPDNLRWETLVLAWVILFVFTTLHEFAHGLTCKHYGGEVHEVGFLLMFFMPCFYCNVSDAWLIRERSRRIWITLAGGYCDLCNWAIAVILWRLLLPYTLPYRVAWLVMSICGGRVLLNLNPLVKLDGYYIVSDLLAVPNLRKRAFAHVAAHLRWLLWGAPRPAAEPRGRLLFTFGLMSWLFSAFFLSLMLFSLFHLLHSYLGLAGGLPLVVVAWIIVPSLCTGLSEGEIMKMLKTRWFRVAGWLLVLGGVPVALWLIPMDDMVTGTFKARPAIRIEVRAPVSGFLQEVRYDEGDGVKAGELLACLDIPDLPSRIAQKRAEEREADAKLKLLVAGSRPEEIAEQREKVARAKTWVEQAEHELKCKRVALKEELHRLGEAIALAKTQLEFAAGTLERSQKLWAKNVLPLDQYEEAKRGHKLAEGSLVQTQAQKREREALGTLEQETELARRVKDLADAQSMLTLMEAGTRPEQIDAEKAHLARVQEERRCLEQTQARLRVACPVGGVVVTPRVREKQGLYLKEGDVICEIEDPDSLELEVPLEEQDVARVEPSQEVDVKPRGLPLETFTAHVERLAPLAVAGKVQSTVTVYCRLQTPAADLRSGMTGYARIHCGHGSVASYLGNRMLRYFRTEIWW